MNAMQGAAEHNRRQVEKIVAQAWWNGALNDLGQNLKPLKYYIDQLKAKPQTAEEVLTVFHEHKARGAPIRIRHIGPDGKELN